MADELLPDEHLVPTQLGERVPILPFLFPFDWTQRQVYWMSICFYLGGLQVADARTFGDWLAILGYMGAGILGVFLEYVVKPSPEFWLSAWLEYLGILVLSFPLWFKRLLPIKQGEASGIDWPLATLPHWLGKRLVQHADVLPDGLIRIPGRPGRPPSYALVLSIQPRPHPDLLPMRSRATIIQTRLNIFRRIRGRWSLHLQVRTFDPTALEIASGPAWGWVKIHVAPRMVTRLPSLVLYGEPGKVAQELYAQSIALLDRFAQSGMIAWRQTAADARRLAADLWADAGLSNNRVRIGIRRVFTGMIGYRSWVLIELPRIIHLSWLRPLTSEALLCDIAFHVNVRRPGPTKRALQRKIRQWRAVEQDVDYELAIEDAERILGDMRRNKDTEATVGLYVTARVEQATKVADALETAQCEFRAANIMQHRALRTTRTLGGDPLKRTMRADIRTVATTDLLATAGYWPDGGVLIGEAMSAPEPIALNPFDEMNLNWGTFVAIMSGGGKTTLAQTLAWRMANPHPLHPLAGAGLLIVSVDFKATGDYNQLYKHLADRGQKASYNPWTSGAIPSIDGHMGFNLSDVPEDERGDKLLELTNRIEDWAVRELHSGRQMLLLLDEVLAVLEARGGPAFLRRWGTQSRSMGIAPVFMTQDVELILANRKAAQAFKNCATVIVGRQNPAGLKAMARDLDLDDDSQMMLESAPQGACLVRVERKDGPVVLGLQTRPTTWELQEFGTNPSERARRWRQSVATLKAGVLDEVGPASAKSPQLIGKEVHVNGFAGSVRAGGLGRDGFVEGADLDP